MKIGYILNTYPQPSQSFIRREIRALERLGFEVSRIAMRRADIPLVDSQDQEEAARTRYLLEGGALSLFAALVGRMVRSPRTFLTGLRSAWQLGASSETGRLRHLIYLAEAAAVADLADRKEIDHLHAHFGTNAAAVALLVRELGGPPFSFTVHGPEEFDAPRQLSLGTKMARAAFTVAISQYGRSQLCRWADPADWARLAVVHCGIETDRFADPVDLPAGPPHLLAIGRLVEQKGQLTLIEALSRTESGVALTLIGDGPLRGDIEALVQARGLTDRVTLLGWCDEKRIIEELGRAGALVMPSFAEGLPMVLMEAMAAARPVIATYVAGIPELVQDGKTGWLIPAGDPEALSAAIDRFAKTPREDLAAVGLAARERALARHDIDGEARKLAALFREAAERH